MTAVVAEVRVSLARCRADVAVADAVAGEWRIRWVDGDGCNRQGTVRTGTWTVDGLTAPRGTDPRDAFVRVSLDGCGVDMFPAWQALTDAVEDGCAVLGERVLAASFADGYASARRFYGDGARNALDQISTALGEFRLAFPELPARVEPFIGQIETLARR